MNKVPPPRAPFLPLYLWGKFKMLFLGGDPPIVIYPGNAGSAGSRSEPTDENASSSGPPCWRWSLVVAGFLAFLYFIPPFFITPPRSSRRRSATPRRR